MPGQEGPLARWRAQAEAGRPESWTTLRPCEETLVDAKAVDERAAAGETLPLAGLTAVTGELAPGHPSVRRLTDAGAVVLGSASPVAAAELVDIAIGTGAPCTGVVGLTPTHGLGAPAVFARTVADGQRVLSAITDSCAWPSDVRLSAGERPRIAVSTGIAPRAFRDAVEDVIVSGATAETVDPAQFLADLSFDALLLPENRAELAGLPAITVPGVTVVARAFEDQVALDLAAFLHTEQLRNPYCDTGIDLVVFGTHLRGQPGNGHLANLGARFRGEVRTAERYRMVLLSGGPEPGIVATAGGAALTGERWTISPDGCTTFLDGRTPSEIELADGTTAIATLCTPARNARDITEFGEWRAYLRHLTATRPMCG